MSFVQRVLALLAPMLTVSSYLQYQAFIFHPHVLFWIALCPRCELAMQDRSFLVCFFMFWTIQTGSEGCVSPMEFYLSLVGTPDPISCISYCDLLEKLFCCL